MEKNKRERMSELEEDQTRCKFEMHVNAILWILYVFVSIIAQYNYLLLHYLMEGNFV